jgi:hypothetical protein
MNGIVVEMSMRRHADINRCFGKYVFESVHTALQQPDARRMLNKALMLRLWRDSLGWKFLTSL